MELPTALSALVADLQRNGFSVEAEQAHAWPGGREVELARPYSAGVARVRIVEDHGLWEVKVEIAGAWYEPFMALRALEHQPHQQRALSHEERRAATLGVLTKFTGGRGQVDAVEKRREEVADAYNRRWTYGGSNAS